MASAVKALGRRVLGAGGIDPQQVFAEVRLRRSVRQFERAGWPTLPGYDVTRHYGDQVVDASFRWVQEGFIQARLAFIRQALGEGEIAGSTFADIGDSNGVFLKALGKAGVSINASAEVLRNIAGLRTVEAALPRLPVPDGAFDYTLCFETLEHVHDPIGSLQELARVSRKGVFISVPDVRRTNIYRYWEDRTRPAAEQHVFECADADWRRLFTYAALTVRSRQVHTVFDRVRTPVEWAVDRWWRMTHPDLMCAVFRRFSIYHLTTQEQA